ncbi:acyl carrier protein [Peptoniphilus koenoeneniae]|uniref:Acyl carrier protein n=1 Tax=Peptoniphilus koenoeneniae TaxID=507751 RepID=A0ABU0AUJ3_9FIRM|nr:MULTISPECIES: acyl carrier protein [Peptoniphilus]ERT56730.1 putative acyl carrier protein [Peptoniphilus sp. BV3C26]MDQ0274113.1 acyl carrier protein [Peptoniphilus koenoeneniae]
MKDRILELIAEQFGLNTDELTDDIDLRNDLNADSIDLVELVMSLEDEFGIEVNDEDLKNINTIGDIIEYASELEEK